jgi:hypothetical protein
MQVRFPQYVSPLSAYPPANVLVTHTRSTISTSADGIAKIIATLGGKPNDIARLVLEHLSASTQQTSSQSSYALSTGAVIDLMANSRTSAPLRYALLSRHSVRAVTNLFLSITAKPFVTEIAQSTALCMANCGHYLGYAPEQTNGSTWVVQTLDAQFLSAILRSGPWIPHMNPGLAKHFLLPSTTILPQYLMYTSVLRTVSRAMRNVRSLGLEDEWFSMARSGMLEQYSKNWRKNVWRFCHNQKHYRIGKSVKVHSKFAAVIVI